MPGVQGGVGGGGKGSSEEIGRLVSDLRARLMKRLDERVERMQDGAIKVAKDKELERMRDAFQIDPNQREGKAFDFETDKKKQERMAKIRGATKTGSHSSSCKASSLRRSIENRSHIPFVQCT